MRKIEDIDIIEEIKEVLQLTGNPYLIKIFENYKDDKENLHKALRRYNNGIFLEINEDSDEEEREKNQNIFSLIYINGMAIDPRNISRIELDNEYNSKKLKINYFIRIIKKFPSPLEEEYIIPFDSEEERDKGYEILKGKLNLCKIYIA